MDNELRRTVDDALMRLGAYLGGEFNLDDDGMIGLTFADDVACTIEVPDGSDHLHFHAPVMRLPAADGDSVRMRLLERNLFRLGMPGAWLALDGDEVLLCAALAGAAFDAEELPGVLLALTGEVRELRRTLLSQAPSDDAYVAESLIPGHLIRG